MCIWTLKCTSCVLLLLLWRRETARSLSPAVSLPDPCIGVSHSIKTVSGKKEHCLCHSGLMHLVSTTRMNAEALGTYSDTVVALLIWSICKPTIPYKLFQGCSLLIHIQALGLSLQIDITLQYSDITLYRLKFRVLIHERTGCWQWAKPKRPQRWQGTHPQAVWYCSIKTSFASNYTRYLTNSQCGSGLANWLANWHGSRPLPVDHQQQSLHMLRKYWQPVRETGRP